MAAEHLRLLPVRLLIRDRYDNAAKLPRVQAPILLHGAADTLIPPGHMLRLAAIRPDATVAIVPGAGHELAYRPDAQHRIAGWLASLKETP